MRMVVKTTPKGSLYKEPIQPRGYASQRSPWGGLIWALNYFKPFKSTGTDGITLAQTLKCMQLIGPRLLCEHARETYLHIRGSIPRDMLLGVQHTFSKIGRHCSARTFMAKMNPLI